MRRAVCAALMGVGLLACGCGGSSDGPERVPVSGNVSFDGTPVETGEIRFIPTDGTGATDAAPIENGAFTASVIPGSKRVEVVATKEDRENMVESGVNPGQMEPSYVQYIPETYNTATTLTAEIKSDGEHTLPSFELKSSGG